MDTTSVTLQKAYQLIKTAHKQQAVDLLTPISYAEPENAQVWYLLGFAHTDPALRIHAFEQTLRIDPANQPAQKQLAKLRSAAVVAPVTQASIEENAREATAVMSVALRWVMGIGGVLLLCLLVFAVGLWWTLQGGHPTPVAQPAPVTASFTHIPAQTATPLASPTRGPRLSPSPRPSVTPYPRRATLTPIFIVIDPNKTVTSLPERQVPTSMSIAQELTAAVPVPTLSETPSMDVFTDKDVKWQNASNTISEVGHLEPGETVAIPWSIDTFDEFTFLLQWSGKKPASFTLTNPNGLLIDETYAKAHPQEITFEPLFGLHSGPPSIKLKKPLVGLWKVNITAFEAGDYNISDYFKRPKLIFAAASNASMYLAGDFAVIAARLENDGVGVTGATVTAVVDIPDAAVLQKLTLTDLGDGRYATVYQVPDVSGYLGFVIAAEGQNIGVAFRRFSLVAPIIGPSEADVKITSEHADHLVIVSDGSKNLDVEVGVNAAHAGTYVLYAKLMTDQGNAVDASVTITLEQGYNLVTFHFSGKDITFGKRDGPYTFIAAIAPMKTTWQTAAYHWQDFNP